LYEVEKNIVICQWRAEYYMYLQQTHLDDTTHDQTIIFRQLFADRGVGYQPMKWD